MATKPVKVWVLQDFDHSTVLGIFRHEKHAQEACKFVRTSLTEDKEMQPQVVPAAIFNNVGMFQEFYVTVLRPLAQKVLQALPEDFRHTAMQLFKPELVDELFEPTQAKAKAKDM